MRLFGLLIFIFFFGFLTNLHAQNGSAGQPFTSLGQAQNVATDGVYYFSLSGTNFSTYVRVGGWVQVAIDFRPGVGNLPQSTALNNTVRGILSPSALSTLGSATVTRVLTSHGQLDVQNTRPGIINRIVNNQTLLATGNDNADNTTNWTGTNTLNTSFAAYGNTTAYGLNQNIFHAGNNGDGIHWIPYFNMQQIKNSAGDIPTGAYFQLLVRAPMVAVVMGPTINTQPSTTAQTVCLNSATTALSVSASSPNGSAITYQWYSNASNSTVGGTAIGGATSASYTPPSNVAGTKYYYAICTNNQGSTTTNVSAAITIQSPSVGGTASSNQTICGGTSPANLSLASNTGSIQWQSSTDNITFTNIAGATSSSLTSAQMGVLNATRYYRANVTNGVCASAISNTLTITVNPAATFTSTTGASICGTGTATLQATTAAGTINWYAASTGGASLGTGTSFTTPSINTTTSYYADVTNNGCTSNPRTAVLATVSAAPNPTITQTGCGTLSIGNLTANALDLGVYNSSKYVTIPATLNSTMNTNNITLEGWFYFTSLVANTNYLPMLIGEAYNVDANITYCMHRQGNIIIAGFYNGGWQAASSSTFIPINTWIHIASTYDQNQVKLYFNGVLNATFNSNQTLPISGNQPWYLGKRWDHLETLGGVMDEIRIWNVARTQAQIQASMNSTVPTNSVGLRAYYKLDESTGNIASDATGNGYDGTLSNGPTWQVPSTSPLNTNGNGNTFTYLWSPGGQTTSSITPATSGTYSAVVTNAAGCQSASISSSIIVGVTASSNQTICSGTSPANLTLSGSTTTVQWQSSTDNITFTNIAGATSTTLSAAQMGTLNSTRYYRASYTNGACAPSTSTTVTITVTSLPTLTSTSGASRCGTGTVTLQATAAAGTINWYAASTGGASLGTGTSYTTPSIASTTTYYVDVTNNGCTSNPRTAVVATVNTIPTPTITQSGCGVLTLGNYGAGNALNLGTNNTSKYVSIPSSLNASFNTNNITVEGWFNLSVADPTLPEPMLVGEAYISDNKVTFMLSRYSNQIRAGFFSGTWTLATSASSIPANTWTHIAATYDQTSIKIYINGVLDATLNTSTPIPTGNEVWYLGKRFAGADMISGLMDEVRIWNVARTQVQIQSSMNTNVPINSTGLRAYYQLDESTGTTASDATGNGFTGTLMNGPTWQVPSTSILGGPPATFLWSPGGQTTNSITPVTSGTYSAVVTNAAGCQSASISSSIVVGVTASSNQTICSGTSPANLTLSGSTTTVQWQSSTDNITFTNIAGATSTTLSAAQMGTLNSTRYYRASYTNGACPSSVSTTVTITVTSSPTLTSTSGASRCGTGTVTLQATAAAGTINWYAASTGGASLGTGTSYTTPSIASTTTYYVDVTNNGCTSNPRTAVVATINTLPLAVSNTSGAVDYLVVGGGGGGGFDGAGGGGGGQVKMGSTPLSSGTFAVTIGNGGANGTSYGTQGANGGTTTLSLPTPIVSIGGGGAGSKGANGATGANGGGGGHSNYAGAAGAVGGFAGGNANGDGGGGGGGAGTAGASGSAGRNGGDGVLSSISGSATYYGGGGGGGSYGNSGIGLGGLGGGGRGGLGNSPLATAGAANTGGGGGGAGEAQSNPGKYGGSGVVIVKYAGAQNGTGGVITSVGGYTIHTFNANGSFVFNGAASSAVVPHMSSCGASAITFTGTALGAGITLDWYDAASGGNLLSQGTTTYTTPVISTTTTYYVAARNTTTGCVSATRTAVIATIYAIPTISTATGASICASGTTTLQATTAAGTINWYAALTGGASLGTGTSFTTPSIAATTTYYAEVTNNGCTSSPRTAVVATVNTIPTLTSTTGASICGTGTATLQATTAAGTINWYAALTGGASFGTGTSYTTPSIATTTTYYADVTNNGCTSTPRTAVVATVNSLPQAASNSGTVIDYLVVGGGGGGGEEGGGGGGGGRVNIGSVSLLSGSFAVTIGNGGAGATTVGSQASNGGTTTLSLPTPVVSIGGGGGGSKNANGVSGANGGGGGHPGYSGGASAGGGFTGGNANSEIGGGGAGAGGVGISAPGSGGGIGVSSSISGSATFYGGGGGGGSWQTTSTSNGVGGTGGGGRGGISNTTLAQSGVANTGGGGGGSGSSSATPVAKNGGSGIVIVRYLGSPSGTGGTITQVGGYTIHTFNSNGTFAFNNPSSAVVPNVTVCGSISATFTGTVAAGLTLDWYNAASGGTLLSQGTLTYTTPALASTTTYYVAVRNVSTGCVSATRTAVTATIITGGTASSNQTVCPGLLPSAITLTNYGGTLQWQTSNDNVNFTNIASQTAATLPANSIGIMSGTKYIRAMVTNGGCATPSNVVTLSPANVNVLTPLTASSYVWNGQSSNNWGTLSNWYSYNGTSLVPAAALPGSTANTIIPANTGCILTQPTLSSGAIIINSLILETGSQLTQSGGTLLLYTNFVKNGSLISTGGLMNFYGPTSATISGSGAVQFAKMRVNKLAGATLTLQIPVSVADSLTMVLGNIYTTTNNLLTLGLNSATPGKLVYTNGTIVGPFKRFFANAAISGLAGRFPVGTATYNRYAQFDFGTTPGVDQSLTVQYVTGTPNQAGSPLYNGLPLIASGSLMQNYSADGYWSVLPTNDNYASPIASVNYDVTLFANNLTGMQTPQICRIIKSAGSDTAAQNHVAWSASGTHTAIAGGANPLAFLISSTASQGFSWFNIGTPNSQALPVEFAGMTTTCEEEAVSIRWTTESEHNNDYFRIEKSTDGSTWDILGYVDAVGNSSVLNGYEYLDLEFRSNTYYRLYQVDQDGSEEMLSTLYSDCDVANDEIASFPNPSHETFSIYWKQFNTSGDGSITIRDINGKTLHRETVELSLGANLFMIKAYLAPGVYMIELMDDDFERRLIKHVVK
jgi:hypothetical protein